MARAWLLSPKATRASLLGGSDRLSCWMQTLKTRFRSSSQPTTACCAHSWLSWRKERREANKGSCKKSSWGCRYVRSDEALDALRLAVGVAGMGGVNK